jgi:hypothetical protein
MVTVTLVNPDAKTRPGACTQRCTNRSALPSLRLVIGGAPGKRTGNQPAAQENADKFNDRRPRHRQLPAWDLHLSLQNREISLTRVRHQLLAECQGHKRLVPKSALVTTLVLPMESALFKAIVPNQKKMSPV